MRITPIPDAEIWEGSRRIVVGPPTGHDPLGEIRPLEALLEQPAENGRLPTFSIRCVLEEGDAEALADGGAVWITLFGHVVPISVGVAGPPVQQQGSSPMFTAKIRCTGKTPNAGSTPPTTTVTYGPDYGEGKNAEWAARTPTINVSMAMLDEVAARVEVGDEITLTFSKQNEVSADRAE